MHIFFGVNHPIWGYLMTWLIPRWKIHHLILVFNVGISLLDGRFNSIDTLPVILVQRGRESNPEGFVGHPQRGWLDPASIGYAGAADLMTVQSTPHWQTTAYWKCHTWLESICMFWRYLHECIWSYMYNIYIYITYWILISSPCTFALRHRWFRLPWFWCLKC